MVRLFSLALLLAPAVAAAQTCPAADGDLGSATGPVASGDTCAMGSDQGASCGGLAASEEVIYTWTAPSSGAFAITTTGSAYDTVVYVIDSATCGEEVCNDDANGTLQSSAIFDATAGATYLIAVDGFSGSSCGAFRLSIDGCAGDADADGICDDVDACQGDNWTGDYDSDGICDDLDPCPDSDGDYVCDVYDQCQGYDWSGDFDSDGICDDLDPCVPDTDGDGTCDAYDYCIGDDASGDSDGDGVCDSNDFVLDVTKTGATNPVVLHVTGAPAGAVVTFVVGGLGGTFCPGVNDPVCFDVSPGRVLGHQFADANGEATFSFVNPRYNAPRTAFQASWRMAGASDLTQREVNYFIEEQFLLREGFYTGTQTVLSSTCGTAFPASGAAAPVDLNFTSATDFVLRAGQQSRIDPMFCAVGAGDVVTCDPSGALVVFTPEAVLTLDTASDLTVADWENFSIVADSTVDCVGLNCAVAAARFGTTFPCDVTFQLDYSW